MDMIATYRIVCSIVQCGSAHSLIANEAYPYYKPFITLLNTFNDSQWIWLPSRNYPKIENDSKHRPNSQESSHFLMKNPSQRKFAREIRFRKFEKKISKFLNPHALRSIRFATRLLFFICIRNGSFSNWLLFLQRTHAQNYYII